jgi:hypothetical protein
MVNQNDQATDSDEYVAPLPQFDRGMFRWTVARYIKRLIRARWKSEPDFLSDDDLQRWRLANIRDDSEESWRLLSKAAADLGMLNREFLPRCGSGGVAPVGEESPVSRLIMEVAFLAPSEGGGPDHNQDLVDAAEILKAGGSIDWENFVDWKKLPQIREDLDELPESAPAVGRPLGEQSTGIDRFRDQLNGQSLKLFNYLSTRDRPRVSYDLIRRDEKLHGAFKVDSAEDATIIKALKRLRAKMEADASILRQMEMTIGTDYVFLKFSEGHI